jgi:starvation-inducible DNA-binding protein
MENPMSATKNDLPAAKRKKLADLMDQLLADAIELKMQIKQAHWNVKGESFIALHELFDKVATEVENGYDLIAERIVQLGGEARGTTRFVAKTTQLKDYPLLAADGVRHVEALSSAIAAFNAEARKAIDETAALGDAVSADMFTEITRGLDKQLWFIEAHNQSNQAVSQKKAGAY